MIARIQNLYLFLAVALAVTGMFIPFWSFVTVDKIFFTGDFSPYPDAGFMQVAGGYAIAVIGSFAGGLFSPLLAIVSIVAIFFHKNRTLQQRLIILALFLFLCDLLSGLVAAHFLNQYFQSASMSVTYKPEAGFYILLPEPVLLLMAMKGVKKDEKIVNAYKRL